jgi:uncharacterized protein with gpF-like domain
MLDDRVREAHAEAEGQTLAFEESFIIGSEAIRNPPAAPNCRCVVEYA